MLRSKAYLLFYARNSQKRARIDSVDLPSRRKRPKPSLVTVDSAPLLEAKFRLMAAFERRFKRVVVKHGAAGLKRRVVKPLGARGAAATKPPVGMRRAVAAAASASRCMHAIVPTAQAHRLGDAACTWSVPAL